MFHMLDQFVIYPDLQRVKKLLLADLRDDSWYGRWWSHQKRDRGFSRESERTLMKTIIDGNEDTALRNSSLDRKRG